MFSEIEVPAPVRTEIIFQIPTLFNILLELSGLFDEEVTARNMSLNKRPILMIVRPTLLALNITFIFPCKIWCSRVSPGCLCRFNLNLPTNSCWAIPHLMRSDVRQYRVPYIFQVNHSWKLENDPRNFLHSIGFLIPDNARLTSCQFLSLIQRPCRESHSINWSKCWDFHPVQTRRQLSY